MHIFSYNGMSIRRVYGGKGKGEASTQAEYGDRKRIDFTGITDVVSFDPVKVVLESDYGHITIKGEGLHVNRLSVEKGELDLDGRVDSVCYSEAGMKNKQDSFMSRLLR